MVSSEDVDLADTMRVIEPAFRNRAQAAHIPGVAYGIVANGQLIGVNCFGSRELDSHSPVKPSTVFRIASMTKSFCAAAILQLRDAGKLRLDDPIRDYIPELSLSYPTADSQPITIRQLLTMQAGIPQDDPWADRQLYRDDEALSDFYRQGATFSAPPATRFEYSNYGYMMLGRIVSNLSGKGAMQYITDHLLEPLGMHDTVWNASDVPAERLAKGYFWIDDQWQEDEMLVSGGDNALFAGLFTTVADLGRWVNLFLSAWPPRDEADTGVLKRSSLREMQQPWSLASTAIELHELGTKAKLSTNHYGYGLFLQNNGRYTTTGHGGGLPGFGSYMGWSNDHNIGVIALGNGRYGGFSQVCIDAIAELVEKFKLPKPKPLPSDFLQDAKSGINQLLVRWDDALADKLFADNFFLDLDRPHWQAKLGQVRAKHGELKADGELKAEDWLRGGWRMKGENGWCDLWLSMTPTVPPLVQKLKVESVMPLSAEMEQVVSQLVDMVANPNLAELNNLCSGEADQEELWRKVQLAHLICGECQFDKLLQCNGRQWAVVRIKGERANTLMSIKLGDGSKLLNVGFWNGD